MANLDEKKAHFEELLKKRKKRKRIVLASLLAIVVIGVSAAVLSTREALPGLDDKYHIGHSVNYKNKQIEMTEVNPDIENGQVKLSLQDLEKDNIVYAMYDPDFNIGNNQKGLGVMAYLTPAGRVMVTSSFCEPCYSRKFHIEGDVLVCNVCSTRWSLADLTGLGGGCVKYPPQQIKYTVDESTGQIIINEADLKAWHPRDYDASLTETMNKAEE